MTTMEAQTEAAETSEARVETPEPETATAQPESIGVSDTDTIPVGSDRKEGDLERRLLAIEAKEHRVGILLDDWNDLKEQAAAAKKAYDVAVTDLCEEIRRRVSPTLFDQVAPPVKVEEALAPVDDKCRECGGDGTHDDGTPCRTCWGDKAGHAQVPVDDAWRAIRIDSLTPKLTPGKLKALAEHNPPIVTMGDMADHQAKHGDRWWVKEIKGFGDKGAEQYIAARDPVWAARPQGKAEAAAVVAEADQQLAAPTDSPNSSNGSRDVFRSVYVGVSPGHIAAKAHMHLLNQMQAGKVPTLTNVVRHEGRAYVVVPAPTELGRDAYALRLLVPPTLGGKGPFDDGWGRTPGDAYVGGAVTLDGSDYQIAPVADAIFIHDPQEAK